MKRKSILPICVVFLILSILALIGTVTLCALVNSAYIILVLAALAMTCVWSYLVMTEYSLPEVDDEED